MIMRTAIAEAALGRLHRSSYTALRGVGCSFRDGLLELHGILPSHYLKQVAQNLVSDVEGVTTVVNRIDVTSQQPRYPAPVKERV